MCHIMLESKMRQPLMKGNLIKVIKIIHRTLLSLYGIACWVGLRELSGEDPNSFWGASEQTGAFGARESARVLADLSAL